MKVLFVFLWLKVNFSTSVLHFALSGRIILKASCFIIGKNWFLKVLIISGSCKDVSWMVNYRWLWFICQSVWNKFSSNFCFTQILVKTDLNIISVEVQSIFRHFQESIPVICNKITHFPIISCLRTETGF